MLGGLGGNRRRSFPPIDGVLGLLCEGFSFFGYNYLLEMAFRRKTYKKRFMKRKRSTFKKRFTKRSRANKTTAYNGQMNVKCELIRNML